MAATAGLIAGLVLPSSAQARGVIRDAETEGLIRDYAAPIFRSAGLGSQNIKIHLVNDQNFNAFVVDGHNMFMHAGTLLISETPNQVIGVIAHETGHITGGHLARLRSQVARMQSTALALQLLGLAAMVGGGLAGVPNAGQIGMGAMAGGTDAAMRSFMAYRQTEESSADQAAMKFLDATGQSGRGMLETFDVLADKLRGIQGINPYLMSHPLPQTRMAQLRALVEASPHYDVKDSPELQYRHDLVRAKLSGFLEKPDAALNRYRQDETLAGDYARAIATYRKSGVDAAMPYIDKLIAAQPNGPISMRSRDSFCSKADAGRKPSLPCSTRLRSPPTEALIQIMLAQAMLSTEDNRYLDEVIRNLRKALVREPQSAMGYRQLAMAYGRKGDQAKSEGARRNFLARASLASAEAYFYEGRLREAKMMAKRAQDGLPGGTPQWLRAQDILDFQMPTRKK
ncbi:M48 family metalloprotease [Methyloceanibacter methanicus]|uniref:M48 family metalloprotease n=1 Tax=Methyloceanibacter methanicus TaxID=1774968 RepID=UPI0013011652|nr:M48 family metalloprotease [Methyloceanibacter methanicus]